MKLAKRFQCRDALYSAPQLSMESRIGFKLWPSSVSEYSTLGGTSAYTLRSISPLSSMRSISPLSSIMAYNKTDQEKLEDEESTITAMSISREKPITTCLSL